MVLFHDTGGLARSFPAAGPNAPLIAALEKDTGRSIEDLTVQVPDSSAKLTSLHNFNKSRN